MSAVNVGDHFDDTRCTHSLRTLTVLAVDGDVATVHAARLCFPRPRGDVRRARLGRVKVSRLTGPRFVAVPW